MSAASQQAIEELRSRIEAARQTAGVPLRDVDIDELGQRAENHTLDTNINGWVNPFPADNPFSLLKEYQFAWAFDSSRFKAALMSRQSGKDFSSEAEAVKDCQERPKTEWMIAAPSERQALDSLDQGKVWAKAVDLAVADYQEERGNSLAPFLRVQESQRLLSVSSVNEMSFQEVLR
jgi:hypothetical protein